MELETIVMTLQRWLLEAIQFTHFRSNPRSFWLRFYGSTNPPRGCFINRIKFTNFLFHALVMNARFSFLYSQLFNVKAFILWIAIRQQIPLAFYGSWDALYLMELVCFVTIKLIEHLKIGNSHSFVSNYFSTNLWTNGTSGFRKSFYISDGHKNDFLFLNSAFHSNKSLAVARGSCRRIHPQKASEMIYRWNRRELIFSSKAAENLKHRTYHVVGSSAR